MVSVEPLNKYEGSGLSLFLAGGISHCPDWQATLIELLQPTNLVLFNPRRKQFPMDNPAEAEAQILWEWRHLHQARAISFWFCAETLNPIVLFELGRWLGTRKPIFIGCHPDYQRKADVVIQTRLERPTLTVVYSLADLAAQIITWHDKQV